MTNMELKKLKRLFEGYSEIKLVYLFGSKAEAKSGPLSDYDFAFYFDEKQCKKMLELKFILIDKISRILKTDKVDIAVLNLLESPELKYNIIKNGKLILEHEPFKVFIEPRILNEYFDFHSMLLRHNLTKA